MPLDAPNPLFTGDRLRDLILCYAGPWAFLPYMRNREDSELLWHARQGAILAFAECTVALAMLIVGLFPIFGPISVRFFLPLWLLWCLGYRGGRQHNSGSNRQESCGCMNKGMNQ